MNTPVAVCRQFADQRLDLCHKLPVRQWRPTDLPLRTSCRRSARFERETPITSATVFIGNPPLAATAVAAEVYGMARPSSAPT